MLPRPLNQTSSYSDTANFNVSPSGRRQEPRRHRRRRQHRDTDEMPSPVRSTIASQEDPHGPLPNRGTSSAPAAVPPSYDPSQLGPTGDPPGQPQPVPPTYLPMPAGPTVVQLPPQFDSLMDILQENRLFQLATVNQQREFVRYLRDLNGWLERDVHDRQSELRGIAARVDQLRDDLHDIRTQGGLAQLG